MQRLTAFVAGVMLLASPPVPAQEPDRKATSSTMDHSHMPIALPDDAPTPALSLRLREDAVSGFNLELVVERFLLGPPPSSVALTADPMEPALDAASGFAEGHAHLYVNGEKIQRLYGPNVHLPGALFRPGINPITVNLNDHSHMYWTRGGRAILATLFVDPDADRDGAVVHRFESFPAVTAPGRAARSTASKPGTAASLRAP